MSEAIERAQVEDALRELGEATARQVAARAGLSVGKTTGYLVAMRFNEYAASRVEFYERESRLLWRLK